MKSYFSGCLTLLMTNPFLGARLREKIYLVDLKEKYVRMLPPEIQRVGIVIKHSLGKPRNNESFSRFTAAYDLMKKYGEAKLVVTQRIHCALPCVAMNTPVVFFNSAGMPGGGGSSEVGSARVAGLTPLFHSVDFYEMSTADARAWISKFPWHDPPPNPNPSMMMRLRASAWNVIRQHRSLYDAGRKFGVIPMSPPISAQHNTFLFHLVVPGGDGDGTFNWRQWRCVESIFHHHPTSEVVVHSNSLPLDTFDVLTESGYLIRVENYNLVDLLRGSPAEDFIQSLEDAKRIDRWSHSIEAELLCLLVLHKQGGIYLSADVILVRPIDGLLTNSLGWEESTNTTLGTAFMAFERGNSFLGSYLNGFRERFKTGSLLAGELTKFWRLHINDIHILSYFSFFTMIRSESTARQCFQGNVASDAEIVKTRAYGVQLSNEYLGDVEDDPKPGSLCGYLLSEYCVLCSNVH